MRHQLTLVCLLACLGATAQMIDFQDPDWQSAMDKAKADDKLLMVYLNTEWCEPCLEMEEGTFLDPKDSAFYSENFVNVPFDAEAFPGAEIADRYDVFVYPAYLFINSYGELIHKGCGWMRPEEFISLGETALDEEKNLMSYQKRFTDGLRAPQFLAELSSLMDYSCSDVSRIMKTFYKDLPQEEWLEEPSWTMINFNIDDPFSPQFQYLITYDDLFAIRYGRDTIDAKIYEVLLGQFIDIYEGADLTLFANQALQKMLEDLDFAKKEELVHMIEMQYAEITEDWELYGESVVNVVDEQNVTDPDRLNEFAWKFYLYIPKKEQLDAAITWMEKSLREEKTATSLDTYASLLFKTGRSKEAIKWEKKAIQMADDNLEDLTHYQLQMEKFKMGR
ncbi:thioredoxin family protein [Marinoscillum sp. MHG1-6]|uniref:thioredoxin family protein n=1 Tax=Marinoscillum sp. MHG1-6 TaxID=2959627 RepID=UPI0021587EB1|nr:thioredoxin family protein [Marinoscillum sp. MHG1-6]